MPLQDSDIIVIDVKTPQVQTPDRKWVPGVRYVFTVRDMGPFSVEMPEVFYTKELMYQLILRKAAEHLSTVEMFGPKG